MRFKKQAELQNQRALRCLHCCPWPGAPDNQLCLCCRASSCGREGGRLPAGDRNCYKEAQRPEAGTIPSWRLNRQMPSHCCLPRWASSFGPVPKPMCPSTLSSSFYGRRDSPRDGSVPADGSWRSLQQEASGLSPGTGPSGDPQKPGPSTGMITWLPLSRAQFFPQECFPTSALSLYHFPIC